MEMVCIDSTSVKVHPNATGALKKEVRNLLDAQEEGLPHKFLLMDKAYCGSNVREKAISKGFIPVVPPKMNCKNPWEYDKETKLSVIF